MVAEKGEVHLLSPDFCNGPHLSREQEMSTEKVLSSRSGGSKKGEVVEENKANLAHFRVLLPASLVS